MTIPIYISLACISSRLSQLDAVLSSLISQSLTADKIFLNISNEPFMLDAGIHVSDLPAQTRALIDRGIVEVLISENSGPYRKLLPVLERYRGDNFYIATADDDVLYPKFWLEALYKASKKERCIAAFRCRAMRVTDDKFAPYNTWSIINSQNVDYGTAAPEGNPLLTCPTGRGGVMYHSNFLRDFNLLNELRLLCPYQDDIAFKFATLVAGIPVVTLHFSLSGSNDWEFPGAGATSGSLWELSKKGVDNDVAINAAHDLITAKYGFDLKLLLQNGVQNWRSRDVKVGCVMMMKDEAILLEPWLRYYGYMFGYENLVILDNGSTSEKVRSLLEEYSSKGIRVDYSHDKPSDFIRKGEIISQKLKEMQALGIYDFLFPVDCDDFVVLLSQHGVSCSREAIHEHLNGFLNCKKTIRINHQVLNIPSELGYFYMHGGIKTIYAAENFSKTDRGFHLDGSCGSKGFIDSLLTSVHFHNKPFDELLKSAKSKLGNFVDFTDKVKLRRIIEDQSPGAHLAPYFFLNEEEYLAGMRARSRIYFGPFVRLMKHLEIAPNNLAMITESHKQSYPEASEVAIYISEEQPDVGVAKDQRRNQIVNFRSDDYLRVNPDVLASGLHGVAHYLMFGFKEGRLLY